MSIDTGVALSSDHQVQKLELHQDDTPSGSANGRSRIVIVSTVFGVLGCEPINKARDRSASLPRCGRPEIVIRAHSGSSIQTGIFNRLPPGSKTQSRPVTPLWSAKDLQDGTMERGETGRRPEHSVLSGLRWYCGRQCHHPHIHMIVPGGGISLDGQRWISSRPAFLLPVRVLGALFRRLFLTQLIELYGGRATLPSSAPRAGLADLPRLFLRHLAAVRKKRFVVYAKPPFSGPEAVLAYLSRYTHRVAISNRRLIAFDETGVTFRYKDYRRDGPARQRVMTLAPHEFIRRFLLHVLPRGFHRIRHYGRLLASSARKASIARARELLGVVPPARACRIARATRSSSPPCPCCGGRMFIIETFERWRQPRAPPHASASTTGSVAS